MHGEVTVNDNGRLLLSLLNTVNLYSLNACTAPASPHQHITCDTSHGGTRHSSLIDYVIASADIAMPCQAAARPTATVGSKTVGATDHLLVFARFVRPVVRRPAKQVVLRLNAQPKDFRLKWGADGRT
jgi:hypothetical protein